jgi:hypothetical protein
MDTAWLQGRPAEGKVQAFAERRRGTGNVYYAADTGASVLAGIGWTDNP